MTAAHVRTLVIVAAVLVAGGVNAWRLQARAEEAPQRVYAPFPAAVVAKAQPLPQFAASPWARVNQQFASLDAMWTDVFAASRAKYEAPQLVQQIAEGCSPNGAWAGVYCGGSQKIVIDLNAHVQRFTAVGGGNSDLVLGYIVAHEVGHHVQELRGAGDEILKRELHADCLAGVWGKAAGLPLPPTWMYGEDADHGTATQRIQSLNVGYRAARPADCDAIWSGPAGS